MKSQKPSGGRGVAYIRVSSDKQDTKSQKAAIQRWLDEHGLTVERWYEDIGSRDVAYKRADFQRLLKDVENGQIDWIIVYSKDRFGTKNSYEFGRFANHLQEHDCHLWSVSQGCLTADDDSGVTEILAAVDSRFTGHTGAVNSLVFSPDGLRAVSGGKDKTLRVWKLP